jgi:hypothetical protein
MADIQPAEIGKDDRHFLATRRAPGRRRSGPLAAPRADAERWLPAGAASDQSGSAGPEAVSSGRTSRSR